ncbi:hypothetical protein JTE90_015123 [Oedothorax gibbosus]|uniref:Integrase catalytic domain-containing protein n=1 Tax=Oedothorax gibbosus TaxID=931172 RepID=A0AAV6VRP7_9ARAC|nr:hypothetical protein JTE90_015123 [Oedothorax gibbosus]
MANGLIEEFHRPLKAAIKAYNTDRWSDALPTTLLGFRTIYNDTLQATTSQLGKLEVEISLDRLKPAYTTALQRRNHHPSPHQTLPHAFHQPPAIQQHHRTTAQTFASQQHKATTDKRRHSARTKPGSAHDSSPSVQSTPSVQNQNNSRYCRRHLSEADCQDILREDHSPTTSTSRVAEIWQGSPAAASFCQQQQQLKRGER